MFSAGGSTDIHAFELGRKIGLGEDAAVPLEGAAAEVLLDDGSRDAGGHGVDAGVLAKGMEVDADALAFGAADIDNLGDFALRGSGAAVDCIGGADHLIENFDRVIVGGEAGAEPVGEISDEKSLTGGGCGSPHRRRRAACIWSGRYCRVPYRPPYRPERRSCVRPR